MTKSVSVVLMLGVVLAGCSSGDAAAKDESNATDIPTTLTLENVFLEHNAGPDMEPDDPAYRFPVAAHIFYGYRPLEGFAIKLSENCPAYDVAREGTGFDATYVVRCLPGGESDAVALTTASTNYGQEETDNSFVAGTSFAFADNVTLEEVGDKEYELQVTLP